MSGMAPLNPHQSRSAVGSGKVETCVGVLSGREPRGCEASCEAAEEEGEVRGETRLWVGFNRCRIEESDSIQRSLGFEVRIELGEGDGVVGRFLLGCEDVPDDVEEGLFRGNVELEEERTRGAVGRGADY
jgi:hypothetical protein